MRRSLAVLSQRLTCDSPSDSIRLLSALQNAAGRLIIEDPRSSSELPKAAFARVSYGSKFPKFDNIERLVAMPGKMGSETPPSRAI